MERDVKELMVRKEETWRVLNSTNDNNMRTSNDGIGNNGSGRISEHGKQRKNGVEKVWESK